MRDYDYDGGREDMRSDARAEGGGGRRYRYSCGDATCGASDCGDCRNGDDEEEDEVEEDEVEEDEVEEDDDDDDQVDLHEMWQDDSIRLEDVYDALNEAGIDPDDNLEAGDAVRALTAERDEARRERDQARAVKS